MEVKVPRILMCIVFRSGSDKHISNSSSNVGSGNGVYDSSSCQFKAIFILAGVIIFFNIISVP